MKGKDFTSCRGDDNVYTPYSMTEQLLENEEFDYNKSVLEPACGKLAIVTSLIKKGYFNDGMINYYDRYCTLFPVGKNFIDEKNKYDYIITNPPYKILDEFIIKAKEVAIEKFAFLCKLTHLGGIERFITGIFKDEIYPLTKIYLFTRQANIRFTNDEQESRGYMPYRELRDDGKYPAGMFYYCWLIWERKNIEQYNRDKFPVLKWINNNKYILLKKDI